MGNKDVVIYLTRLFLDQTRAQVPVKDAAVYLARYSWNVLVASYRWADPENRAAIAEDELWGGEDNDQENVGVHVNSLVDSKQHCQRKAFKQVIESTG